MRQIGQIVRLQVQRSSLKRGEKPARYYDPTPIQVVEAIELMPQGVTGITSAGERIVDVHNSSHPQTKNSGENPLSFGFTSHYRAMRARFGEHLPDGSAGENILIQTEERITLEMLGRRVALQEKASGARIYLDEIIVAAPCLEFSRYALNEFMPVPAEMLREALIFLNDGMRGFYATIAEPAPVVLHLGERPKALLASVGHACTARLAGG